MEFDMAKPILAATRRASLVLAYPLTHRTGHMPADCTGATVVRPWRPAERL